MPVGGGLHLTFIILIPNIGELAKSQTLVKMDICLRLLLVITDPIQNFLSCLARKANTKKADGLNCKAIAKQTVFRYTSLVA